MDNQAKRVNLNDKDPSLKYHLYYLMTDIIYCAAIIYICVWQLFLSQVSSAQIVNYSLLNNSSKVDSYADIVQNCTYGLKKKQEK